MVFPYKISAIQDLTTNVTQAVKCLLCEHEALSSNPSPTKKKKRKGFQPKGHFRCLEKSIEGQLQ
jgi:hypothetical protein